MTDLDAYMVNARNAAARARRERETRARERKECKAVKGKGGRPFADGREPRVSRCVSLSASLDRVLPARAKALDMNVSQYLESLAIKDMGGDFNPVDVVLK